MFIRGALFTLFVIVILGFIGWIFWQEEYRFSLPTPKPITLKQVNIGDSVVLKLDNSQWPTYLHFYNYDCPCSRFNEKEFKLLVNKYSSEVNFIAVLETAGLSKSDIAAFKAKYDLGIQVIEDRSGELASDLGVYSTPQAVMIKNNKVFYKGNYNKARFCLTKNTKFAEQALDALVNDKMLPSFPSVAFTAYGCELPSNNRKKSIFSLLN